MVLRPQSLEWFHGGDETGEVQVLLLHPTATRVRATGDTGDDAERCMTVSGRIDGYAVTLVLRCADNAERDLWLRAICLCVESLKACTQGHTLWTRLLLCSLLPDCHIPALLAD